MREDTHILQLIYVYLIIQIARKAKQIMVLKTCEYNLEAQMYWCKPVADFEEVVGNYWLY